MILKVLQDFYVGLSDTNTKQELTETSLLRFLEDLIENIEGE